MPGHRINAFLIEQIVLNCPGRFGLTLFWLRFLYLCSRVRLTYNFAFFVMFLSGLAIGITFASKNEFGMFLCFLYFSRVRVRSALFIYFY